MISKSGETVYVVGFVIRRQKVIRGFATGVASLEVVHVGLFVCIVWRGSKSLARYDFGLPPSV